MKRVFTLLLRRKIILSLPRVSYSIIDSFKYSSFESISVGRTKQRSLKNSARLSEFWSRIIRKRSDKSWCKAAPFNYGVTDSKHGGESRARPRPKTKKLSQARVVNPRRLNSAGLDPRGNPLREAIGRIISGSPFLNNRWRMGFCPTPLVIHPFSLFLVPILPGVSLKVVDCSSIRDI